MNTLEKYTIEEELGAQIITLQVRHQGEPIVARFDNRRDFIQDAFIEAENGGNELYENSPEWGSEDAFDWAVDVLNHDMQNAFYFTKVSEIIDFLDTRTPHVFANANAALVNVLVTHGFIKEIGAND